MTNPDLTAIAVLFDRSGSMIAVRDDAEGALRAFITAQREVPGVCTMRLDDFDVQHRMVYPSTPIDRVPDYRLEPRGGTALLDGIGRLVSDFGRELAALPEDARPGNVIVVVQTDGQENASHEWNREKVFDLITEQQNRYGWTFIFLGAGKDAIQVGTTMGFRPQNSMSYSGTGASYANTMGAASNLIAAVRGAGGQSVGGFTDEERDAAARS